ncbi:hypothetical protein NDU88_009343 [Pleurodeles waltl]|uniref:Uncharacterized protein n=1 Tax=Pleurodeles waltl TaxID=8319 RepID=A0AAV7PZ66_PLEWA|nr:hypothetical protein NDU88_009343 [Pleurodeles waltl]
MRVRCLTLKWRMLYLAIFDRVSVMYICFKEIGLSEGLPKGLSLESVVPRITVSEEPFPKRWMSVEKEGKE